LAELGEERKVEQVGKIL